LVHLNGGKDFDMRPAYRKKNSPSYPHLPQAVCVAGGCGFLNQHLLLHWIGRTIAEDRALLRWLPKSPAPTSCDVFLWGYVKVSLHSLYHRICLSCEKKNHRCLLRNLSWRGAAGVVGNELSTCRLCVTKGGHTEHLGVMQKLGEFLILSVGPFLRSSVSILW